MIAGDEDLVCVVYLDAKKLLPWFSTHRVGLQVSGLAAHVLSHRSEVLRCTKHRSGLGPDVSNLP